MRQVVALSGLVQNAPLGLLILVLPEGGLRRRPGREPPRSKWIDPRCPTPRLKTEAGRFSTRAS
eukprot:1612983-Rhodomonas_salina.3